MYGPKSNRQRAAGGNARHRNVPREHTITLRQDKRRQTDKSVATAEPNGSESLMQ
jgi:hypothetical protein